MLSLAPINPPAEYPDVGDVMTTIAALDLIDRCGQSPHDFLAQHISGVEAKDPTLACNGVRQMSVFRTSNKKVLWVISQDSNEAKKTTLLLPWEYSTVFINPLRLSR